MRLGRALRISIVGGVSWKTTWSQRAHSDHQGFSGHFLCSQSRAFLHLSQATGKPYCLDTIIRGYFLLLPILVFWAKRPERGLRFSTQLYGRVMSSGQSRAPGCNKTTLDVLFKDRPELVEDRPGTAQWRLSDSARRNQDFGKVGITRGR